MPPSPRDSSDRSPAPPPFPRPSAPSSIGCINASSTTSINSFTPWASRSPHESRPEHRTSQREQNPRYPPHNGLTVCRSDSLCQLLHPAHHQEEDDLSGKSHSIEEDGA